MWLAAARARKGRLARVLRGWRTLGRRRAATCAKRARACLHGASRLAGRSLTAWRAITVRRRALREAEAELEQRREVRGEGTGGEEERRARLGIEVISE